MRPVSPTTSTLLYEDASGLQLTPRKGHRFSLGLPARNSIWDGRRSLYREYVETPGQKRASQNLPPLVSKAFLRIRNITLEGVKNSSEGSGATPRGRSRAPTKIRP
jgi:hypothetical protein